MRVIQQGHRRPLDPAQHLRFARRPGPRISLQLYAGHILDGERRVGKGRCRFLLAALLPVVPLLTNSCGFRARQGIGTGEGDIVRESAPAGVLTR